MIKLVATDLDGTLLGNDNKVSIQNIKTIKYYNEQGVKFAICTGRTMSEVYHIDNIEDVLPYIDNIIYTNGASCIDKNRNMIFDISMNHDDVDLIHSTLSDMSMMFEVYTDGSVTCNEDAFKNYKEYITPDFYKLVEDTRNAVPNILEFSKNAKNGINMLLISFLNSFEMKKAYEKVKNLNYYITFAGKKGLEFNHNSVDKGNGISNLAKKLGILKSEILSIGDSHNDISMRKAVDTLVSTNNAIDELKEISDYITYSNIDDGVHHALKKFL